MPYPEQIDNLLNWPLGTAARLARRGKLPHYRLPDGSIRFDRDEIAALIVHVAADAVTEREQDADAPTCADVSKPEVQEAPPGFEPGMADLQSAALPLG